MTVPGRHPTGFESSCNNAKLHVIFSRNNAVTAAMVTIVECSIFGQKKEKRESFFIFVALIYCPVRYKNKLFSRTILLHVSQCEILSIMTNGTLNRVSFHK